MQRIPNGVSLDSSITLTNHVTTGGLVGSILELQRLQDAEPAIVDTISMARHDPQ